MNINSCSIEEKIQAEKSIDIYFIFTSKQGFPSPCR